MNLIETNHQIKINSDHYGSSNNSFKVIWMLKVSTCSSYCSSCAKHADSAPMPVTRVIWIQLQEKIERNPQHQQMYHLMVIVMKKLLM